MKSNTDAPGNSPSRSTAHCVRKPGPLRSLSARLTEAQREILFHWLAQDGLTYAATLPRLAQEFGIVTSDSALSNFWSTFCSPRLVRPPGAVPPKTIVLETRLDALTGQVISVTSKAEGNPKK